METTLLKNNSIQNSVGNEENGYPVPNFRKTMINGTMELSNAHKKTLKQEIWEEISEKFLKKILDMVNQNVQDRFKKFRETENKEHEMTQKQIKELREDLNKHQSETKDTIKREIHELKRNTNYKRGVDHRFGKPQKKDSNTNPENLKSL
jgi:molecular chaperone DnaK (HSP70)